VKTASALFVGPDVLVDGLVADGEQPESAEPTADLLGAEVLTKLAFDECPVRRSEALVAARPGAAAPRLLARRETAIATVLPAVTGDLTTDGATMPAQSPRDRCRPQSLFLQRCEGISLFRGELVVGPHE